MPRVKQVTARKDYPQFGIAKGQLHYHWKLMTGPRSSREFRQVEPPRPSQLTTSEFLGDIYDAEESLGNLVHDDGLASALREIADNVRTAGDGAQERFDNMPEGLQMGDTGQRLEERASNAESWADEIEMAADNLDEKTTEIEAKEWYELDEFSHLDPEDDDFNEDDTPSEDEIGAARAGELATAYEEAIEAAQNANPGFD